MTNNLISIANLTIFTWFNFIDNIISISAGAIAIYIYFTKRDKIKTVLRLVFNYSLDITVNELKDKLAKMNRLSMLDKDDKEKIWDLLYEIQGQLSGNKHLADKYSKLLTKVVYFTNNPKYFNERAKISLCSEFQENLRSFQVGILNEILEEGE